MGMLKELKQDMADNTVDAIMDDPKTQEILKISEPFIKPALKSLLKELGNDSKRFMLFFDTETKLICFMSMKTEDIKSFEVDNITKDNIFTIDPEEIKKGNIKNVIKSIIKKLGLGLI